MAAGGGGGKKKRGVRKTPNELLKLNRPPLFGGPTPADLPNVTSPALRRMRPSPNFKLVSVEICNVVMDAKISVPPDFDIYKFARVASHAALHQKTLFLRRPGAYGMKVSLKNLVDERRRIAPAGYPEGWYVVSVSCRNQGRTEAVAKSHIHALVAQMNRRLELSAPAAVTEIKVSNIMVTVRCEREHVMDKLREIMKTGDYLKENERSPQIVWKPFGGYSAFFNVFDRGSSIAGNFKSEEHIRGFIEFVAPVLARMQDDFHVNWRLIDDDDPDVKRKTSAKRAWREPHGTGEQKRAKYQQASFLSAELLDDISTRARSTEW